jgi:hypothetical protein
MLSDCSCVVDNGHVVATAQIEKTIMAPIHQTFPVQYVLFHLYLLKFLNLNFFN